MATDTRSAEHEARQAPQELRPVGTKWQKLLPGNPLDPRSKGHKATYQVVNHVKDADGKPVAEVVQRVGYEKVR